MPPDAARRLPARLRRAARRARPRRRAVRPLRRRLRPRAASTSRSTSRAGRRVFRRFVEDAADLVAALRRLAVGRARRRPGPQRAAAADVLARRRSSCSRQVKGLFDPDDLLNPGVLVDPRPARRRPAAGAARAAEPPRVAAATRTTAATSRGRAPLHRRRQVPRRQHGDRRRDVPVVPRHPRREGLHPRPRPGAAGDGRRRALVDRRLALRRGARGARPLPVVQGLRLATARPASTWRPTRPRCCTSATAAGCGRARTTRSAGCPRWPRVGRRSPGWRNAALRVGRWRRAGHGRRRGRPAPQAPGVRRASRSAGGPARVARARRTADADVVLWVDTFTDRFAPRSAGPPSRVLEAAGPAGRRRRRARVLRAHLDQHRPARRRPAHRWGAPLAVLHPYVAARRPGRRPRAVVPGDAALRRGRADRRPAGRRGRGRRCAPLAELLAGPPDWAPPDLDRHEVVAQPHCHHATRDRLGGRRGAAGPDRAPTVTRVGGCCGLAGNFGVEQGHYEVSVAVAEHDAAARASRGRGAGTRSCSPTASPAAPSSTTSPGVRARAPGRAARRPTGPVAGPWAPGPP